MNWDLVGFMSARYDVDVPLLVLVFVLGGMTRLSDIAVPES
jgi:hypothetical protein